MACVEAKRWLGGIEAYFRTPQSSRHRQGEGIGSTHQPAKGCRLGPTRSLRVEWLRA